jgi:L-asparaginase
MVAVLRQSLRTLIPVACCLLPAVALAQQVAKPNVFIAATGGTIAGAQTNVEQHGYTAGELGIATLISAVPQLKDIANVTGEQVMNIPSQDMNDALGSRWQNGSRNWSAPTMSTASSSRTERIR